MQSTIPAHSVNIASIDIGTNTVLLLVAEIDSSGTITPLVYEQRVPRLGKGVDLLRNLRPESMMRVIAVLKEYKTIMSRFELESVVVCGTSAVRDAENRMQFAGLVRRETGFNLEILSGDDEAHWTYRGAISGITSLRQATIVDIGGGSTEISVGDRHTILRRVSLNIGSVRLTERFFRHDPPKPSELEGALEEVRKELAKVRDFEFEGSTLIGVAGTATSLAILNQGLPEFAVQAVSGYPLKRADVDALYGRLCTTPSMEIRSLSTVMEGRSDVITAGSLILREIMNQCGFKELVVSERGVRYGLAIREWEKSMVQ